VLGLAHVCCTAGITHNYTQKTLEKNVVKRSRGRRLNFSLHAHHAYGWLRHYVWCHQFVCTELTSLIQSGESVAIKRQLSAPRGQRYFVTSPLW